MTEERREKKKKEIAEKKIYAFDHLKIIKR